MKILILLTLLSGGLLAQNICHEIFKKNIGGAYSNDLKVIDKLNRMEEKTAWLNRQVNKNEITNTYLDQRINKDFQKLEKHLLEGNVGAVTKQVSALYSKVQFRYLRIKQYDRLSRVLREAHQMGMVDVHNLLKKREVVQYLTDLYGPRISSLDDISRVLYEVEKTISKDARILGKNFQRYEYYESSFNRLLKEDYCNANCIENIKSIRKNVGILSTSRKPYVRDLIGSERNITLSKVRTVFNSTPKALLVARKRELLNEGIGLLKRITRKFNLMRKFVSYLGKNIGPRFKPAYRMLRSVFDERYLQQHAKGITRVVNSDLSVAKKFSLMRNETKALDEKMFWVDFSRLKNSGSQRAWREVKEYASHNNLPEYNSMLEAEKIGKILGSPRNKNIRNAIRIISVLTVTGGAIAYFSFDVENDDDIDTGGGNNVNTNSGSDINTNSGNDLDVDSGNETQSDEDDETTVLIDYLSPESNEIDDLMLNLSTLDQEVQSENYSEYE